MHLRHTYDNLGVVMNGEGLLVSDYLWKSVANQYQGYLTGQTLSEVGQTSLGRLKNKKDQSTGYGSLIPFARPVQMTWDLTGYVLELLTVVKIVV